MCANNVGGLDRLRPSTGALVKDALDFSDAPSHPSHTCCMVSYNCWDCEMPATTDSKAGK